MADKHPYVTAPGNLTKTIQQLRRNFPSPFTAETLKKLGIAPNGESYVISVLRFLELIDNDGNKTNTATQIFSIHDSKQFEQKFSECIKKSYLALFELHGDRTWNLDTDGLIQFFRSTDYTSESLGKRQARSFKALAELAGRTEVSPPKPDTPSPKRSKKKSSKQTKTDIKTKENDSNLIGLSSEDKEPRNFGLTVRIEINLPADGAKETYDNIFRSIRENLLNE